MRSIRVYPAIFCILIMSTANASLAQIEDCHSNNIIFTSERTLHTDIYLINTDDLEPIRLTSDLIGSNYDASFSPDSMQIVFVSETDSADLYMVDFPSGEITQLTSENSDEINPNWLPDGSHIAYASNADGDFDIYLMNVDDPDNIIQLTNNEFTDIEPSSSPDGSHIVYSSDVNGTLELYLIEIDSPENILQLTDNDGLNIYAEWSADSGSIVFSSGENQNFDLYQMNMATFETTLLFSSPFNITQPAISSDGKSIAFASNRNGNYEIYILEIFSGNTIQLTDDTHFDGYPVWQPSNCDLE